MAGELLEADGALFRFGQSFTGAYGDGIFAFRVTELDELSYKEELLGEIRFEGVKGPHTLNFRDGTALFDWYRDRFSPLAWLRRLKNRNG